MMNKNCLLFFLWLTQSYIASGQSELRLVQPFEPLQHIIKTSGSKQEVLEKANKGEEIPTLVDLPSQKIDFNGELVLLDGESFSMGMEIKNDENISREYLISTDLPLEWKVSVRRQAILPDYYSYPNPNKPYVKFIGDALPKLKNESDGWSVTLLPHEAARFYVDFIVDRSSFNGTVINFKWEKEGKTARQKVPVRISGKTVPDEAFNSVIFNNNSYQMGRYVSNWLNIGLNNLILYSIPTYEFDASGNVVGEMNAATADSKEFRYVVDKWSGQHQPFLFYWTKRFNRLAPLADAEGEFLEPYSPGWNNAYINLVKAAFSYIKSKNPEITEDKILLYVEDEITSGNYTLKASDRVRQVESLLKQVKEQIPQFKVFLTLGMYTFPPDLQIAKEYADILVPLAYLPDRLPRRAPGSYNPAKAFEAHFYKDFPAVKARIDLLLSGEFSDETDSEVKGPRGQKLWNYLVSSGKATNILDYRALPVYAVLLGRGGMSWWAFSDRKGSSWLPYDQESLDYSMVYNKETGNALYQYWNKNQSEEIIPSIRLYAARAGIQDAKILKHIIKNQSKLSEKGKKDFQHIVKRMASALDGSFSQVDTGKYLTLEEYEQISQTLREIYTALQ